MGRAWRIVKAKHVATAFDGEGARLSGGRWNSRGTPVVYASASQALAALETLVHLNPPVLFRFAATSVQFDDALVERLTSVPSDWKEEPPPPSTRQVGDTWVNEARSVVLEVPSVLVPRESNYLLNPAHPDFAKLVVERPELLSFDPRLL